MSEGNIEIVQRLYELYRCGEISAAFEYFSEDIEWVSPLENPDASVATGRDEALRSQQDWDSTWDRVELDVHDLTPAGDHVVAHVTLTMVGAGSGAPARLEQYQVWTLRDCKIVRVQMINDKQAADEAAGLVAPANNTTEANAK